MAERGRRRPELPLPTPSEAAFEALLASFRAGQPAPQGAAAVPKPAPPIEPAAKPAPPADVPRAPAMPVRDTEASSPDAATGAFLDDLYARQAAFLERDRFATIGDADEFYTKVVGVTFEGRQDSVAGLRTGSALDLVRDPRNVHDANAVAVRFGSLQIGYLRREIAKRLAPHIDGGRRYRCEVDSITGGGSRSWGVNIRVWHERPAPARAPIAVGNGTLVPADVLRAFIGERELRDAQRAVIERVDAGRATLAVLGTGRGKSLCFAYPAALRALERGEKTLVLYPLRALANDQFDALTRRLEPFGLRVLRANGSIDARERAQLMTALEDGSWDILCATPEFVTFHTERFTQRSRPSLVVVDEAHHCHESTHRAAYGRLGETIAALGAPQVLALTATAGDECFAHVVRALRIDAWVVDPTVRANLQMVDARNTTNKIAYLQKHLHGSGKAIVYCNSRAEATKVAQTLRDSLRDTVAFYHAGMPSAERGEVERRFRDDSIRIVVATSAFGEGIDLPDVRNVVLYHLNFNFTEFNQQSGRAGRDGEPAAIHLLFGQQDRNLNDFILEREAPTLATLRAVYREMRRLVRDGPLRLANTEISDTIGLDKVNAQTVGVALRIFSEAALIDVGEDDDGRTIVFRDLHEKIDLQRTARFAEAQAEREAFDTFCDVVLTAAPDVLANIVNRPIYPSNVPLVR